LQAQQEIDVITGRLERQYSDTNTDRRALIVPLQEHLVGDSRKPLLLLMSAVGLVLLIAVRILQIYFWPERPVEGKKSGSGSRWALRGLVY